MQARGGHGGVARRDLGFDQGPQQVLGCPALRLGVDDELGG